MKRHYTLIAAIALALSIGTMPGAALAALQAPQDGLPQEGQAITTQAKKETVYVITGVKEGSGGKTTYSYNGKGLVSKRVTNEGDDRNTLTWKYDKNSNLKSIARTYYYSGSKSTSTESATYKTTKAGVLKSEVAGDSDGKNTVTYKSSKGYITSVTRKTTGHRYAESAKRYTYKEGRMATMRYTHDKNLKGSFAYDSKGNLKTFTYGGSTVTFQNKYAKGRLKSVKRQLSHAGSKLVIDFGSFSYSYKAVKVPAGTAAKVQAQQWAILNGNLNFALGGDEMIAMIGPGLFGRG